MKKFILSLLIILITPSLVFAVAAFPGAEGYGSDTTHAYGGTGDPVILIVDELGDSATASGNDWTDWATDTRNGVTVYKNHLRAAVEEDADGTGLAALTAGKGRIIIFETSGTIDCSANDYMVIEEPWIYIAGQTAPSPGILLKGCGLDIRDHDIVVQHIRAGVGDHATITMDLSDGRPLYLRDTGGADGELYNVVVDHGSWYFGIDGIVSIFDVGTYLNTLDITLSNNIFAVPLGASHHGEGAHGYNITINESKTIALLKNVFAFATYRYPNVESSEVLFLNNVVHNWAIGAHPLRDQTAASKLAFLKNRYSRGTGTYMAYTFYNYDDTYTGTSELLIDGNYFVEAGEVPSDQWVQNIAVPPTYRWMSDQTASQDNKVDVQPSELSLTGITQWDGVDVLTNLLANSTSNLYSVGAFPAKRSSITNEIDEDVLTMVSANSGLGSPNGGDIYDCVGSTNLDHLLHDEKNIVSIDGTRKILTVTSSGKSFAANQFNHYVVRVQNNGSNFEKDIESSGAVAGGNFTITTSTAWDGSVTDSWTFTIVLDCVNNDSWGQWPTVPTNTTTHTSIPASPHADGDTNNYDDMMDWIFEFGATAEGVAPDKPTLTDEPDDQDAQSAIVLVASAYSHFYNNATQTGGADHNCSVWEVAEDGGFTSYVSGFPTSCLTGSKESYTISGGTLDGSTTYYWRTTYRDTATNDSEVSDSDSFTTGGAPPSGEGSLYIFQGGTGEVEISPTPP
jgi:hypothetical protein